MLWGQRCSLVARAIMCLSIVWHHAAFPLSCSGLPQPTQLQLGLWTDSFPVWGSKNSLWGCFSLRGRCLCLPSYQDASSRCLRKPTGHVPAHQACWITSLCFKGNEHPLQNLLGFGNRSIPKTWRKIFTKVNSTMHTECTPCKHHVLFSLWGHPAIGLLGIWSNTILKINKISFLRQEMLFSRERVDIKFIPGQ